MLKIEYTPQALVDLQQLQEYLSSNWGENTAKKVLKNITTEIRRLEIYPFSGVDLGKTINTTTDYRYIFSEKNYVFYRLEFETEKILIIRVINERQNYLKQLFENSADNEDID